MPVYNVEDYLYRSIESIINQTYDKFELIIVNDGSTDNSEIICRRFENQDSRIKVFTQRNAGSGAARQFGIDESIGKYICFVDPDDFIHKDALETNVKIALQFEPDLITNDYFKYTKDKTGKTNISKQNQKLSGYFTRNEFIRHFSEYEYTGSRALWNKLYKKRFLVDNNITFSNQRTGQDAVFNYTVYKYINSIFINNEAFYYYDQSREGSAVKKYNKNRFNYEMNIAKKYEEMFDYWGVSGGYSNNILNAYWSTVVAELVNITGSTSPLTLIESQESLKMILSNPEVISMFENSSISIIKGNFSKILYSILKQNHTLLPFMLMKIYNKLKLGY